MVYRTCCTSSSSSSSLLHAVGPCMWYMKRLVAVKQVQPLCNRSRLTLVWVLKGSLLMLAWCLKHLKGQTQARQTRCAQWSISFAQSKRSQVRLSGLTPVDAPFGEWHWPPVGSRSFEDMEACHERDVVYVYAETKRKELYTTVEYVWGDISIFSI